LAYYILIRLHILSGNQVKNKNLKWFGKGVYPAPLPWISFEHIPGRLAGSVRDPFQLNGGGFADFYLEVFAVFFLEFGSYTPPSHIRQSLDRFAVSLIIAIPPQTGAL